MNPFQMRGRKIVKTHARKNVRRVVYPIISKVLYIQKVLSRISEPSTVGYKRSYDLHPCYGYILYDEFYRNFRIKLWSIERVALIASFFLGCWFQVFLIFTPIWGTFPSWSFWLILFHGVETTNWCFISFQSHNVYKTLWNERMKNHSSSFHPLWIRNLFWPPLHPGKWTTWNHQKNGRFWCFTSFSFSI